jgi:hypothetical protein
MTVSDFTAEPVDAPQALGAAGEDVHALIAEK